jgi:C1A family cysteine protease
MCIHIRHFLEPIAIAAFLCLIASMSGSIAGAAETDEITWQIEIKVAFTSDQITQPGWEANTRALQSALTMRLQSNGTRLDTLRAPSARGDEFTFRADGKGTAAQFRRVAFDDLSPVGGLLGSPAALTLEGAVKRGESVSLVLESNPSTGYSWDVSQLDAAVLQTVGAPQFQQKANMPGAPAKQTIKLNVAQDGPASLALVYRRPFEAEEPMRRVTLRAARLASLADVTSPVALTSAQTAPPDLPVRAPQSTNALSSHFNWASTDNYTGAVKVTPIRNQGSCGSCWAFATVAPFESNILIKDSASANLSEQYLVSCNTSGWSCSGGWWAHDYHESRIVPNDTVAGAVYESAFPYGAYNAPCNAPYSHPYKLNDWYTLGTYPTVNAIKNAIYNYGPVSAALCAGSHFGNYSGGVFTDPDGSDCTNYGINHAITLVGWDDATATWVLRNSWGPYWGESAYSGGERGYMRIVYGTSLVGYNASYVVYNGTPLPCYNLTASVSPGGGGSVLASPAPNCNATQYTQGTVVTLTATPACGHTFSSWSGALSGSVNPATVTLSGAKSVTANFGTVLSTCFYIQLPFALR